MVNCVLSIFEALHDAFGVHVSGLHFYTILKSLVACKAMQLGFSEVKTLLMYNLILSFVSHFLQLQFAFVRDGIQLPMKSEAVKPEPIQPIHFKARQRKGNMNVSYAKPSSTTHGTLICTG